MAKSCALKTVAVVRVAEWSFTTKASHPMETPPKVNALFINANGREMRVPAFRSGPKTWKVRFSSPDPQRYSFVTECEMDPELNDISGELAVTAAESANPLFKHGPPEIGLDKRHLVHHDGSPFFWLADTWWMGLCKRLEWPGDFQTLLQDRLAKGFTVVQIVAGLYPDMGAFDPRGANEAGFPWNEGYTVINSEYFNFADRRIDALVKAGIAPCIVGAWGYHLPWLGAERMKEHWRNIVARWGAYPVFWCVAGEANLPWYLVPGFPYDDRPAVTAWTEIVRYVHEIDPYNRPVSIHPTGLGRLTARGAVDDDNLLDFDMLQTGHGDRSSLAPSVQTLRDSIAAEPAMPVLNSEVCYEGLVNTCWQDVQRLMFWTSLLSGAAGHTYGANGIWQMNRSDQPYGNSPHGGTYGPTPWDTAMQLPGSGQLGKGKELLMEMGWPELMPIIDGAAWLDRDKKADPYMDPYCAVIGNRNRLIFLPRRGRVVVKQLQTSVTADARWIDPASFHSTSIGGVSPNAQGEWTSPEPPDSAVDWLLAIEPR